MLINVYEIECKNNVYPVKALVAFLACNGKLVNEICTALGELGFSIIGPDRCSGFEKLCASGYLVGGRKLFVDSYNQ